MGNLVWSDHFDNDRECGGEEYTPYVNKGLIWDSENGFGDCYYITYFDNEKGYIQINYNNGDFSIIMELDGKIVLELDSDYYSIFTEIKNKGYTPNLPTLNRFEELWEYRKC